MPIALPESMLPVELPELDDFDTRHLRRPTMPEHPRAADWAEADWRSAVDAGLGDGRARTAAS